MGKRWRVSKPVWIAGAVVFVLGLLALAAPFLVPVDSYRPLIVWAIEAGTGRQVTIEHLQLYLLPSARIRLIGFHVQNPHGFPAGDALIAQSVDLSIDARALLSRRLDITDIVPDGVQVNVLRDAAGRSNFAQPVSRTAQGPPAVLTLEPLKPVKVTGAQIAFADAPNGKVPGRSFTLSGVSATIGSINERSPDWAKQLDIVADLRNAKLVTSLLSKTIDFHSGTLTLKGGAGRATFSAAVGSLKLSGSASFPRLDPLSIAFSLSSPELDVASLGSFLSAGTSGGAAAPSSRVPIAHGTIAVGKVTAAPIAVTQLKGQVELYAGLVRLTESTFSAYGGSVRADAVFHGSPGVPTNGTVRIAGLNVPQTLAAFGFGSGKVSGALDGSLAFATRLAHDPKASLTGNGTFAVRNGSFAIPSHPTSFSYLGGDLRIANERGYSNQLRMLATGTTATASGSFGFDQSLNYSGTAVANVLANAPSGDSAMLAEVAGLLNTTLQRDIGAAQVRVPFSLHGTFGNPQFTTGSASQLITSNVPAQVIKQQTQSPTAQAILKLIPGL